MTGIFLAKQEHIIEKIEEEVKRQEELWGERQAQTAEFWLCIAMEELGEAAKAVVERKREEAKEELIQTAAVIISMLLYEADW